MTRLTFPIGLFVRIPIIAHIPRDRYQPALPRAPYALPQGSLPADLDDEIHLSSFRQLGHLDVPIRGGGVVDGLDRIGRAIRAEERLKEFGNSGELRV